MPKIKCPHCGSVQERYPHILLCTKCFEDINGGTDRRGAEPDVSSEDKSNALATVKAFMTVMPVSLRMGHWLSPSGTILERT
jgi:hypothetical protein